MTADIDQQQTLATLCERKEFLNTEATVGPGSSNLKH
jgi:hypothetical protein